MANCSSKVFTSLAGRISNFYKGFAMDLSSHETSSTKSQPKSVFRNSNSKINYNDKFNSNTSIGKNNNKRNTNTNQSNSKNNNSNDNDDGDVIINNKRKMTDVNSISGCDNSKRSKIGCNNVESYRMWKARIIANAEEKLMVRKALIPIV
eukprot:Pgem_evm1s10146